MAVRKSGGNAANLVAQQRSADSKADDKSDQQKSNFQYQRPHRVHTGAERRAALARKHEAELDDEAMRHLHVDDESMQLQNSEEIEEETKLKGVNLDEERKKQGQRDGGDDNEPSNEDEAKKATGAAGGLGKYFEDAPEDRMGDLSLTDPNDIKRQLGPSVRFAQHAMLLADARMKEGMERSEALEFLGSLYLGLADRNYARNALRKFGHGTGILDLYPAELMDQLLRNVPQFLPKFSAGSFVTSQPNDGWKTETGKPIQLTYDPALRIRGFAIKGGDCPGYLFEPVDPDGTYELTFTNPGRFVCLVTALSKDGHVTIEEFIVEVAKGAAFDDEKAAMKKARAAYEDEGAGADDDATKAKKKKDSAKDLKVIIPRYI